MDPRARLKNRIKLCNVNGSLNTSDMMTKNVARELPERHPAGCGAEFLDGCAAKAVQLHLVQREVRQLQAEIKATIERRSSKPKVDCDLEEALVREWDNGNTGEDTSRVNHRCHRIRQKDVQRMKSMMKVIGRTSPNALHC